MGLETIDPHNVKEHTEFHKIPKLVLKKKRNLKCFRRFALRISCPAGSLCFHSFSRCDWFVASSHDFDSKSL